MPLKSAVAFGLVVGLIIAVLRPGAETGAFDPSTVVPPGQWSAMHRTYERIDFAVLAGFSYGESRVSLDGGGADRVDDAIPRTIAMLSGRQVAVSGFMLPLDFDGNGVNEFLLNANYDMCYFGAPTRPNDFIVVRMRDGRRTRFVHTPVWVFGTLQVQEERRDGRVVSLYQMTADAIGVGADQ